jgi:hypothetical protein
MVLTMGKKQVLSGVEKGSWRNAAMGNLLKAI